MKNVFVQPVLTVRIFPILCCLLFTGCATGPDRGNRPAKEIGLDASAGTLYPFLIPGLLSPMKALALEDGEEIYRISLKNDEILRKAFARDPLLTGAYCACASEPCQAKQEVESLLRERERAWSRQLALRLDALEASLEVYRQGKARDSIPLDFARFRLLIETLSLERMVALRQEILGAITECRPIQFRAPAGAFFVPYYTAWLRLARNLPGPVRKDFFKEAPEMPK